MALHASDTNGCGCCRGEARTRAGACHAAEAAVGSHSRHPLPPPPGPSHQDQRAALLLRGTLGRLSADPIHLGGPGIPAVVPETPVKQALRLLAGRHTQRSPTCAPLMGNGGSGAQRGEEPRSGVPSAPDQHLGCVCVQPPGSAWWHGSQLVLCNVLDASDTSIAVFRDSAKHSTPGRASSGRFANTLPTGFKTPGNTVCSTLLFSAHAHRSPSTMQSLVKCLPVAHRAPLALRATARQPARYARLCLGAAGMSTACTGWPFASPR